MSQPAVNNQSSKGVVCDDGMVIDKNKSTQQYITEAEEFYIIPRLVREKFEDLVKLIYETESMNQEEREYWMQILPVMSEEQIVKFRDILVNEKDQLSQLDQQSGGNSFAGAVESSPQFSEAEIKEKFEEIKAAEQESEVSEKDEEQKLLEELEKL